jgi:hypothetical protein
MKHNAGEVPYCEFHGRGRCPVKGEGICISEYHAYRRTGVTLLV